MAFLRTHTPSSKLLLVGLTPRGVWSGDERQFVWPSVFTVPINALNHILRRLAVGDSFVHYVDCGDQLLGNGKVKCCLSASIIIKPHKINRPIEKFLLASLSFSLSVCTDCCWQVVCLTRSAA